MDNICIFTLGRTSCENFISWTGIQKWQINSFDIMYNRIKTEELLNKKPDFQHICKIYIETCNNSEVYKFVKNNIKNYKYVHFFRSNTLKHYLTQKLQDNLIGKYGIDYKEFYFDEIDYKNYIIKNNLATNKFLNLYYDYEFINYDVELALKNNDHQGLSEYVSDKIGTFEGAFDLDLCKKFIKNFNLIENKFMNDIY